jgi:hypothetical protein
MDISDSEPDAARQTDKPVIIPCVSCTFLTQALHGIIPVTIAPYLLENSVVVSDFQELSEGCPSRN